MARFVFTEDMKKCPSYVHSLAGYKEPENYTTAWEVGTTCSYPTDNHGFRTVCEIPGKVAIPWINEAGIIVVGHFAETQPSIHEQQELFGNKDAVVVDVSWGKVLAIYKHDFHWYLIKKDLFEEGGK